jgi:hypothetical protein
MSEKDINKRNAVNYIVTDNLTELLKKGNDLLDEINYLQTILYVIGAENNNKELQQAHEDIRKSLANINLVAMRFTKEKHLTKVTK